MREAAVMLVIKDGLILSVSRKEDHTRFGLPGGKRENFESMKDCAIREIKEETSIVVKEAELIFIRNEPPMFKGGEYFCTYCFLATSWEGESKNSEDSIVTWLTADQLTGTAGAFPIYNKKTLEVLTTKFPNIELK